MPENSPASPPAIDWIPSLAEPYLRRYRPVAERGHALHGYWFLAPDVRGRGRGRATRGFFAGYLLCAERFEFLAPQPPECLVFAFAGPVRSAAHRRLVTQPDSLLRKTAEYIRWLTHRPPRFAFFADELPALVRHVSMRGWPPAKHAHYSRNFFIETLAWLVRSGLMRRLVAPPARAKPRWHHARKPVG